MMEGVVENGGGVVAAPASSCRPKVAIIGAGSVGLYVGARLASAGRADVCFLMRSDFAAAKEKGVNVESVTAGNMRIATPWCVRSAYELGACDWVVCALKSTAVCEAALKDLVAPCFEQGRTKIQILMNGLGIEEQFAEIFGAHNVRQSINAINEHSHHCCAYRKLSLSLSLSLSLFLSPQYSFDATFCLCHKCAAAYGSLTVSLSLYI